MSIIEIIDGVERSKIFGRVLWNDINHPASALTLGAAAPDSISILGAGGIKGLGFNGNATEESVHGSTEILHGWLIGSEIEFHAHFMPVNGNTGNVKWNLEYSWQAANGTFPDPTTISVVVPAGGVAWKHLRGNFPLIDGTGMGLNSAVVYRLYRDPSDVEDTYGSDAALIQVGIHYQIDVYGSRSLSAK